MYSCLVPSSFYLFIFKSPTLTTTQNQKNLLN